MGFVIAIFAVCLIVSVSDRPTFKEFWGYFFSSVLIGVLVGGILAFIGSTVLYFVDTKEDIKYVKCFVGVQSVIYDDSEFKIVCLEDDGEVGNSVVISAKELNFRIDDSKQGCEVEVEVNVVHSYPFEWLYSFGSDLLYMGDNTSMTVVLSSKEYDKMQGLASVQVLNLGLESE